MRNFFPVESIIREKKLRAAEIAAKNVQPDISWKEYVLFKSPGGIRHLETVHSLPWLHKSGTVHPTLCNGVETNFGVGVGEARPEGSRVGMGFLGGAASG